MSPSWLPDHNARGVTILLCVVLGLGTIAIWGMAYWFVAAALLVIAVITLAREMRVGGAPVQRQPPGEGVAGDSIETAESESTVGETRPGGAADGGPKKERREDETETG